MRIEALNSRGEVLLPVIARVLLAEPVYCQLDLAWLWASTFLK